MTATLPTPNPSGDAAQASVSAGSVGGFREGTAVSFALAERGIRRLARIPAVIIPMVIFPVFLLATFTGAFGAVTRLGFPTDNIVNWYTPFTAIQGAAFSGVALGFVTANEIEQGLFDRYLLAPAARSAIVVGSILSAMFRATISITIVVITGFILGLRFEGGGLGDALGGLALLYLAGLGIAVVAACFAMAIVFKIKSSRASPLFQLGIFVTMFLSTAQVPLDVMAPELRAVARWNPVTLILELARQPFIGGVTWSQTWPGLIAIALAIAAMFPLALRGIVRFAD